MNTGSGLKGAIGTMLHPLTRQRIHSLHGQRMMKKVERMVMKDSRQLGSYAIGMNTKYTSSILSIWSMTGCLVIPVATSKLLNSSYFQTCVCVDKGVKSVLPMKCRVSEKIIA